MLADVIICHQDRAVVRLGDVFIKADTDRDRSDREAAALSSLSIPMPELLWRRLGPPDLAAIGRVEGTPLALLGQPSPHPPQAWRAAGRLARQIHEADIPQRLAVPSRYRLDDLGELEAWLTRRGLADAAVIEEHSKRARTAFASARTDHLVHGDLQAAHIFIDDDGEVRGIIDWSDAGVGDPHYDLAVLTVGHEEHLESVLEGYGMTTDLDRILGYQSWRRLGSVRWMVEHGFDPSGDIAALTHGL